MADCRGLIGDVPAGWMMLGSCNNVRRARQNSANRVVVNAQSQRTTHEMAMSCGGEAESLYDVLGIWRGATKEEIKSSYRRLARVFHPDAARSSGEGEKCTQHFIKIQRAYTILSNPQARARYDHLHRIPCSSNVSYPRQFAGRNWETDQCW